MTKSLKKMKRILESLSGLLRKYWYFLLLLAAGSLAIGESIRITNKYEPSHWLSGPSGFVMILGIAFIALLVFEAIAVAARSKKQAKKQATEETVVCEEPEKQSIEAEVAPSEEQVAQQKLHNRNMWLSFGMLIVYTLLIKILGFALSSAVYLVLNLLLLKNNWKVTIITVAAILLFLLFGAPALSMSFPRGIFGF